MRATIGIIIVFGILYAAGQWMWKPLDKQSQPDPKVYTLPEKYSLLKNKFGEFIVMVDTSVMRLDKESETRIEGGYMYTLKLKRDTGYIGNKDVMAAFQDPIVFDIHDAQLFTDSFQAVKSAYKIDSSINYHKNIEREKQLEKYIQDSINNLRYSTFKPAK